MVLNCCWRRLLESLGCHGLCRPGPGDCSRQEEGCRGPKWVGEWNKGALFAETHVYISSYKAVFSSVQFSCSVVSDSATPWTAARQASLSVTNSQSLLKLMSIKFVMPSNHLILCHPLLLPPSGFPSIRVFQINQFFSSGGQNIGVSAWKSVLPTNIQDWFPLGLTDWISMQSKALSRIFSNTTVQKHQFLSAQLSL